MDLLPYFRQEVDAFAAAARSAVGAAAPIVPSCPSWSASDLIRHLGGVHRWVARTVGERLQIPPDPSDLSLLRLPEGSPDPLGAPNTGPVPGGLVDWFEEGAALLYEKFRTTDPSVAVWTWFADQSVGFWVRMQTIEAAVHRWDLENAVGSSSPLPAPLAVDAVAQTFEVMAPTRRAWLQAPAGSGERLAFRQTDGPSCWTAAFSESSLMVTQDGPWDVELAGTASDLALFLWQRIPASRLQVTGDAGVLDRYFTLVPPV